eukprot:gnl/TRDRNA2_/TRDRNA2_187718_c0_seq1.p1 gnl/TRDRNA2_/TRDRNA2_187718_c0~~gnl/TRDRNA2_/TRDRNA2_187718_c0_seq1.p1  ORF type:complete len:366 (+),score=80.10 gnl/TRDRNA2_/TRDRNA2_187718_c0_seq1:58-1155(+)
MSLNTPICKLLGIKHPIILAGMNVAAGSELAAAVTNAGGLGVFGGVNYSPKMLQLKIDEIKEEMKDPNAPFGVDLLLPQVGDGARKTNYDYTHGDLPELIDIIIKSGAKLFVAAVGVPPKFAVDKLHAAGILVMNMIGAPKHVKKALDAGVDIICAQGGEGGGHTGDVATSVLIPMVVDLCKGRKSPLTGEQVPVVAAGGIYDGRGLAMALSLGAQAVWVGTRFVASVEGGAPKSHKEDIVKASVHDTHRTLIFTGRPLRVIKNDYTVGWEQKRLDEMNQLLAAGKLPYMNDESMMAKKDKGEKVDISEEQLKVMKSAKFAWLSGQVAGAITDVLPAKTIVEEMVAGAVEILTNNAKLVGPVARL